MAVAELQGRIGLHKALPDVPVNTAWDIGVGDENAIWFWQKMHGKIGLVGYYQNSGEGLPFYVAKLEEYRKRLGWSYGKHLLPHDAKVKEWGSGRTRVEQLIAEGIRPTLIPMHGVDDGINAVRATLPVCYFDAEECATGIKALKTYRKEWDEERACWRDKPRHDWASQRRGRFPLPGDGLAGDRRRDGGDARATEGKGHCRAGTAQTLNEMLEEYDAEREEAEV